MRISNDVLAVLSRSETKGNALTLPPEQLERKLYESVDKVLKACGGKWDRKSKTHIFTDNAAVRLDEIILSGEVEIPKDEFNYFPSPPAVVERLIELAEINPGMRILEPSAGQGAIAKACVEQGAIVDCAEILKENAILLMSLRFRSVTKEDFLTITPSEIYDRVVMNPPFRLRQDIKHVLHALKFLKPGCKLVSVMSASVLFREDKLTKDFRDLVDSRGGFFEELPDGSFKESGTMIKTVIAAIPAGSKFYDNR